MQRGPAGLAAWSGPIRGGHAEARAAFRQFLSRAFSTLPPSPPSVRGPRSCSAWGRPFAVLVVVACTATSPPSRPPFRGPPTPRGAAGGSPAARPFRSAFGLAGLLPRGTARGPTAGRAPRRGPRPAPWELGGPRRKGGAMVTRGRTRNNHEECGIVRGYEKAHSKPPQAREESPGARNSQGHEKRHPQRRRPHAMPKRGGDGDETGFARKPSQSPDAPCVAPFPLPAGVGGVGLTPPVVAALAFSFISASAAAVRRSEPALMGRRYV